MKKRLHTITFLLNPFVISFFIALGILLLLPNYFSKFELVQDKDFHFRSYKNTFYYEDINGDGFSERIILITNKNREGKASYELYKSNGDLVDQFNLDTEFSSRKIAWFQDTNHNGIKEMYLLTKSNDSIFLNSIEHNIFKEPITKKIFVDQINEYNGIYDFSATERRQLNLTNYDNNYVYFCISVGYGGNPRNIYKYDVSTKTITKSPHLTNSIRIDGLADVDQDGKIEIFPRIGATANTLDTVFTKKSDYASWLTVLDDDLQFLFEPIAFKALGGFSFTTIKANNETAIIALFYSREIDKISSKLIKLSHEGKILLEKEFKDGFYDNVCSFNNDHILINDKLTGEFIILNNSFNEVKTIATDFSHGACFNYDINKNGQKEWILWDYDKHKLTILDYAMAHPVNVELPGKMGGFVNAGVRYPENGDSQFFLQLDNGLYIYSYKENPFYNLRYLFYLGVYGLVLLLTFLMVKGQQLREQRKRKLEKEISELQLKTIKNKVDPHFVFNALNTISEMTLTDNKLEADNFITKYAGFMRKTLEHSDSISTSLKEEINYTKTFIELQQIRHQHSFDYQFSIDQQIDKKLRVPKHILFTYVENAIKYGLANKPEGLLKINISQEENKLTITIKDNGWGFRKGHQKSKIGTGNGLKIMDKIFKLYENRYQTKISQEIHELKENNEVVGVEVTLILKFKSN